MQLGLLCSKPFASISPNRNILVTYMYTYVYNPVSLLILLQSCGLHNQVYVAS